MSDNYGAEPQREVTAVSFAALLAKLEGDHDEQITNLKLRISELEAGRKTDNVSTHDGAVVTKVRVVILVHGIRDQALWQSEVRASLRNAGFQVALTNYQRFDLLRFLAPIPMFRNSVVRSVRDQIRSVRLQNPNSDISVIAHSFGTYIVSRVMNEEFDILFDRIIFCGGVYSNKIKFEQFSNRFLPPIINEIGTKDYWPALANSFTWGYGAPGTFGFRRPLFEDRWHKNAGHSNFLSKEFCSDYWLPFLVEGHIKSGEVSPDQPSWIVRLIGVLHIKYVVALILISFLLVYRSNLR